MKTLPMFRALALCLLVGPVFAAPVVSVPGLVGYWRLDEGANPAADDSGNGNTGTWTNGGASGAAVPAGPPGIGFANPASHGFDGVDDLVQIGTPAALNITANITVAAWVNFSTDTTEKKVVSKWSDTPNNYCWLMTVYSTGGPAAFFVQPASGGMIGVDTGAAALATGTWYHLAGTYDGANVRMYLNGVQTSAVPLTGAINTGPAPVRIGAGGTTPAEGPFAGLIDDVRIYNYALSAPEVAALSAGSAPGAFTLSAVAGAGQIGLSWTASSNGAGYTVGRSTTMGGPYGNIAGPAGTSYTDAGLTAGTIYYYIVTARNPVGQAVTNEANATPTGGAPPPPPPPAPSGGSSKDAHHRCGCSTTAPPSVWSAGLVLVLTALALAGGRRRRV